MRKKCGEVQFCKRKYVERCEEMRIAKFVKAKRKYAVKSRANAMMREYTGNAGEKSRWHNFLTLLSGNVRPLPLPTATPRRPLSQDRGLFAGKHLGKKRRENAPPHERNRGCPPHNTGGGCPTQRRGEHRRISKRAPEG